MSHPLAAEAWIHYQPLSNELSTPKVLVCPTDSQMKMATDFGPGFGRSNVSYFVGLDADEVRPNWILSGDRNLTANGVALRPGLHVLDTNDVIGFTKAMHNQCGNIGLSDGSVQQLTSSALQQYLLANPQTNRLALP